MSANVAESIARAFHNLYEEMAPEFGYRTREASAVPWDQVPEPARMLMESVVRRLIDLGVIEPGAFPYDPRRG